MGLASIFQFAIGVVPAKDGFWSTAVQPGHPYKDNRTEPFANLQAAVAAMEATKTVEVVVVVALQVVVGFPASQAQAVAVPQAQVAVAVVLQVFRVVVVQVLTGRRPCQISQTF